MKHPILIAISVYLAGYCVFNVVYGTLSSPEVEGYGEAIKVKKA